MMRRGFGLAVVAALLALSLPLSAVVAHNGNGNGHGRQERITICHKANSAHPVTITIAKAAWKAHKAHGDTEGPCQTPRNPKPSTGTGVCTFDATTSAYYGGSSNTAPLYATGPIHFGWTVATGVVAVPGGFWNELVGSTTYYNNITAGTVSGTGAVNLSFVRTVPDSNSFVFAGQLTGNTLTGMMAGNYFTATGTVSCTGTTATNTQHRDDNEDDD